MKRDKTIIEAFFALVRGGLWEQDVRLSQFGPVDYEAICQLAEEQSVVGLVTAGLEYIVDMKLPQNDVLQFIGRTVQLEQRNSAMNYFIGDIVEKMREEGIFTTLVKGQGVAQCYSRPLWRTSGDIDLFLDGPNYQKAKLFLTTLASRTSEEDLRRLHYGMSIDSWVVELHGTMHIGISSRVNCVLDSIQKNIFENNGIRIWRNDSVDVPLPSPDNDVFIIFTHFIEHFYVGGVGLRQISDWCRLLWTYKNEIDWDLLGKRLNTMGLMPEWQAFTAFAVEFLGMPAEVMPFFKDSAKNRRRAKRIRSLLLHTGNFGHNRDESYRWRRSKFVGNIITFFHRFGEFVRLSTIFPSNAPKFFISYVKNRVRNSE